MSVRGNVVRVKTTQDDQHSIKSVRLAGWSVSVSDEDNKWAFLAAKPTTVSIPVFVMGQGVGVQRGPGDSTVSTIVQLLVVGVLESLGTRGPRVKREGSCRYTLVLVEFGAGPRGRAGSREGSCHPCYLVQTALRKV